MTLLELLVQELPKRGGWPYPAIKIHQDYDGEVFSWIDEIGPSQRIFILRQVATNARKSRQNETCENMVTREQYEAALVAEKQPVWDGEGLPPVGCECEGRYIEDGEWFFFRCVAISFGVAFGWAGKEPVTLTHADYEFRPIQSEADKRRDEAIEGIDKAFKNTIDDAMLAEVIYNAIAAGKIPGVKLDNN